MKMYLFIVGLLLASHVIADDKCRILSFSAGTEKVAYQVGALQAIIEKSDPAEVQYDVISGVSFGAFNAAMIAVHKKGDEAAAVAELLSVWKNAKSITAYKNWWFGAAQGAIFKGGLYDNSPWQTFLQKTLKGRGSDRLMTLGAVSVANGDYIDLTDLITTEKLEDAVFAVTALNVFFPPVHAFGQDWYDGSGVWPIEVIGPISRCHQLGFSDKDIIVDVLMTQSDKLPPRDADHDTTIPSLVRYLEISQFYASLNGIERAKSGFPEVQFRNLISPENDNLPSNWFPFNFDQTKVNELIQRGYDDALKTMAEGPGVAFDRLVAKKASMRRPKMPSEVEAFLRNEAL